MIDFVKSCQPYSERHLIIFLPQPVTEMFKFSCTVVEILWAGFCCSGSVALSHFLCSFETAKLQALPLEFTRFRDNLHNLLLTIGATYKCQCFSLAPEQRLVDNQFGCKLHSHPASEQLIKGCRVICHQQSLSTDDFRKSVIPLHFSMIRCGMS